TPEPVKSRVTRQAEQILHLAVRETPYFDKAAWPGLDERLGGANSPHESTEKLTDVWRLPPAAGGNGHGAEFPLSLPARCIALTSKPGDLVLDPFVGSGTSALAAMELKRRFVGFDISERYVRLAEARIHAACNRLAPPAVSGPSPRNGTDHEPLKRKRPLRRRPPVEAATLPLGDEKVITA
ncbi:MAG: DNA-methyltransferase, partial [Acidimicrobiales bacterium]